ncbi:hypothetical protein ACP70R_020092 [Stipagrostis hirtigluma subsp. patula]
MEAPPPKSARSSPAHEHGQPLLHDELLVDEILTRLPPAAAGRCRAVCRAWNAALTSDHFIRAHRARAAAARGPELLFFAPAADGSAATSLYACSLRDGEAPSAARELLTVRNLIAPRHAAVLSPRPCHGLTLILDGRASEYYVCNLSTGEHVALPSCEPAAVIRERLPLRIGMGLHYWMPPWVPFDVSSAGLGFDQAAGEHKVVRLFKTRIGETSCDVCTLGAPGRWRRCAGRVPARAANFIPGLPPVSLGTSLYWLLELGGITGVDQPILSFSVGAERFGRVQTPPRLSRNICHLTDLDGSLCAAVDHRLDAGRYALITWSGTAWSARCSIDLQSLPRPISDELVAEKNVVPLWPGGRSCSPRAATRSSLTTPSATPWRGCSTCRSSSTSRTGTVRLCCFSTLVSMRNASSASTPAARDWR